MLVVDKRSTIEQLRNELRCAAGDSLKHLGPSWSLLCNKELLTDHTVIQDVLVDQCWIDIVGCSRVRVVVTASNDCTARLFDLDSGGCLELRGHFGQVYACTISASRGRLLTASEDKTARIWTVEGWNPVEEHCLQHDGEVYSAVFSNKGHLVATASQDCAVCLWCSETGERRWCFSHMAEVYLATFSHDDMWVLTASADGVACILNVETGEVSARLEGHSSSVNRAEFSPVSTLVVTASNTTVRLWNGLTSTCLHTMAGESEVKFADFSKDGALVLATRASGSVAVWCVATGQLQWTCDHHLEPVYMAVSCPHSIRIALASEDGTATVWSRTGDLLLTLSEHVDSVTWISFSPWANILVTASWDSTALLWSAESGECLDVLEGHAAAVLYTEFGYVAL